MVDDELVPGGYDERSPVVLDGVGSAYTTKKKGSIQPLSLLFGSSKSTFK